LTVTGTEQRVYGTLVGGCIIDLHRFALVSDSITDSPTTAVTVTYADTTPYNQCGYKYDGFLTLFLSISGASVYAAVEVYICKNDKERIVLETYGEVAKTVTDGMSLWFNKGTDKHFPTRYDFPETGSSNINYIDDATGKYYIWNETVYEEGSCWVKLNSTASDVIMPYAKTSYTFKETKRNGSITIGCCKRCPTCRCKNCYIWDRFKIIYYTFSCSTNCCEYVTLSYSSHTTIASSGLLYGLNGYGELTVNLAYVTIEYKLKCDTINIWLYRSYSVTELTYIEVYYRDDDDVWNLMFDGFNDELEYIP